MVVVVVVVVVVVAVAVVVAVTYIIHRVKWRHSNLCWQSDVCCGAMRHAVWSLIVKICCVIQIKLNPLVKKNVPVVTDLLRKWCHNSIHFSELAPHHGGKTAGRDMVWRNYVTITLYITYYALYPCTASGNTWSLSFFQCLDARETGRDLVC